MTTYSIEVLGGVDTAKFNDLLDRLPLEIVSASLLWAADEREMDKLTLLTRDIGTGSLPGIKRNIKEVPELSRKRIVVYEIKEERAELYLQHRRTNHRRRPR